MKLCTLGFFLIGHLLDFLLILIQVVGPADQSGYYAPFYGPLVSRVNGMDPYFESNVCVCDMSPVFHVSTDIGSALNKKIATYRYP